MMKFESMVTKFLAETETGMVEVFSYMSKIISPDVKQYNSTKITVTVVYRPPDANADWISTFENAVDSVK